MDNKPTNKQRAAEEEVSGLSSSGASSTKFLTDIADAERLGDVTQAMILAGAAGNSRIAAGIRTWAKARSRRGFKGAGATFAGKALRFTGHTQTAMWIDRFFAKPSQKERKSRTMRGIGGGMPSGSWATGGGGVSPRMQGELKVINSKITVLGDAVTSMAEDVSDIKSLLMPKDLSVKGRRVKKPFGGDATQRMKMLYGGGLEGDELDRQSGPKQTISVRYDPLAPQGEQFRVVTSKGELTSRKPNEGFTDDATKKAALATAKLARKIQKKDEEKGALKKKRALLDPKETDPLVAADPVTLLRVDMNKKFEELFKMLGGMEGIGGGKKGLLASLFDSPLMSLMGKAGLVGLAGFVGFEVGTWLNDTFKLDQKINDGIDKVMGWFGKGNQATVEAATRTDEFNKILAETNKKLIGSGWSMVGQGKYANNITNTIFTDEELSDDVKIDFKKRKLAGFGTAGITSVAPTTPPPAAAAAAPSVAPTTPPPSAAAAAPTGNLALAGNTNASSSPNAFATYEQRLRTLGDMIASGESGGDYNIFNKGTIGKNKGKIGREDLSNMTISEYLRRGSLGKDDPMKMFAVGKYQIIPDTMKMIIKELKLNPNTTTLSPEIQDKMFRHLIESKPAVRKYLEGKSDDTNAAFLSLAKEWASIGVPSDIKRPDGTVIKAGESYYRDVGNNKAHTQSSAIMASLDSTPYSVTPSPTVPATVVDSQSRALVAANMPTTGAPTVIPIAVDNSVKHNTMTRQPAPRASSTSQDPSFVRAAGRDVLHPVSVLG